MTSNKRFAILSGPSGVGKGPLQAAVTKLFPGLLDARPILCTSRAPRKAEIHGKDYYFLPANFIQSLEKSPDFAVSSVRSDWQAIHLLQVEELLQSSDLVFAEAFYKFGPALLGRAATRQFESIRVLLLPLPLTTPSNQVISVMEEKLKRRGTDESDKIKERAESAPTEIQSAKAAYTHHLLNPAGEDDVDEWKSLGTSGGSRGQGEVKNLDDLGPNARWLVEKFVLILQGKALPGTYAR